MREHELHQSKSERNFFSPDPARPVKLSQAREGPSVAVSGSGGKKMADGGTPGWTRLSLQVPDAMAQEFRVLAQSSGTAGVKYSGTAAIVLLLALPEEVRSNLLNLIVRRTWSEPRSLNRDEVWETVVDDILDELLAQQEEGGENSVALYDSPSAPRWQIVRILDPELTPPPGQKASDKAKRIADAAKDKGRKSG